MIKIVLSFTYDQKVHHLMAVCPDLVIIISRSDEPPFAKDQPRESNNYVRILNPRLTSILIETTIL